MTYLLGNQIVVVNLDKKGGIKYPSPPALLVESLICEKCEKPMNLKELS